MGTLEGDWTVLAKDDEGLLAELFNVLKSNTVGSPYKHDGQFAQSLNFCRDLKPWQATTHWLDISLMLDSITWHFGNFGEPQLVVETEAGLRELGLYELAYCFAGESIDAASVGEPERGRRRSFPRSRAAGP